MKKLLFLISITVLFVSGCAQNLAEQYTYNVPEDLEDGIVVGEMQDVDIDYNLIANGVERIKKGKFREVHSLLLYKKGKLVVEEYFPGYEYKWEAPRHRGTWTEWDSNKPHHIHSVTKSITSACIGIAIDKGFIKSVDQSIFDYLPDHQKYRSNGREDITVKHLLTMTSGLPWVEWNSPYSDKKNPVIGIWYSDKDPVSYILDATMKYPAGTHYTYYGGSQVILGEILKNASGMDISKFSKRYLFNPMGVDTVDWYLQYPNGVYEAAGCLRLTPRGMLKVGITYLNNGKWKGQQIISPTWVEKSYTNYRDFDIDVPGTDGKGLGYSYSWWTTQFMVNSELMDAYEAGGWGGQHIFVIPGLDAVVVFTGSTYTEKTKLFAIMKKYIVPALYHSVSN